MQSCVEVANRATRKHSAPSTGLGDGAAKRARREATLQAMAHERELFIARFDPLVEDIVSHAPVQGICEEGKERLRHMMRYNIPGGKLTRGLTVVETVKACVGRPLTDDERDSAHVLGWCIEFMQAAFLIADDVMDNSTLRRNQSCWFRVDGIGVDAMNDSFLLEGIVYSVLRRHFRSRAWYIDVVDVFHEICVRTEVGQMLDLWVEKSKPRQSSFERFTPQMYEQIVVNKTAYYSFALPVLVAMHAAGVASEGAVALTTSVCKALGFYFQMQDDFLDCYGDVNTVGKDGTDIQQGKCSWLFVTALQKATPEQRERLVAHYGKRQGDAVLAVRAVFDECDVQGEYARESERQHALISSLIDDARQRAEHDQLTVPVAVLSFLLERIHGRNK